MFELILAHLWGDFILQTDNMQQKKVSSHWCAVHVAVYILPFLLCTRLFSTHWLLYSLQFTLIAVQHFLQDRTNFVVWLMRFKGSEAFSKPPCGPWSIIITDNILHLTWIWLVVFKLPALWWLTC